jgi:hypothetical protein
MAGCGTVSTLGPESAIIDVSSTVGSSSVSTTGIAITDIVPLIDGGFDNVHINDAGIIAYSSTTAFVYDTKTKVLTDLNTIVPCQLSNSQVRLFPTAVNASGIVLFYCLAELEFSSYVWDAVERDNPIRLPGRNTLAFGLNDAGMVVGESIFGVPSDPRQRGFVWRPGDLELTEIAPPSWGGGDLWELYGPTSADRVNAAGFVLGTTPTSGQDDATLGIYRYFVRSPTGDMTVIPGLEPASTRDTIFINDAGQIAGGNFIRTLPQELRAFYRSPTGGITDLGLGSVHGLSAAGLVLLRRPDQASVWDPKTSVFTGLGTLHASEMNDAGQVVGSSFLGGDWAAFLWSPTAPTKLDLGLPADDDHASRGGAVAINNSGQIVGQYLSQSTYYMAVWHVDPPAGQEPVADAGGPYTVIAGNGVLLDGTGSIGSDGGSLSYEWDYDYDIVTFTVNATGSSPTFSTAVTDGGAVVTVALRVTDVASQTNIATSTVTILSQADALRLLIADVNALVDAGTLKRGQAKGLTRPLENALRSLSRGNPAAACDQLADFVVEVDAQEAAGALAAEDAAELRKDASLIRTAVRCN